MCKSLSVNLICGLKGFACLNRNTEYSAYSQPKRHHPTLILSSAAATEFGKKLLRAGEDAFSESLLRHTLFAIREVAQIDQGAEPGRAWVKAEVKDYWSHRKTHIALLQHLSRFQHSLPTWQTDSKAAALLAGALENDH